MAENSRSKAPTIVDLFCGCGGFSLGAELAGFRSVVAIDVDATLQSAYRRNFPTTRAVEASVSEIEASDWKQIIGRSRPDGVIGGPPCQGFSWIGKRRKDDPRNSLIHEFYRHVDILRPKFFVMENVEGLLHGDNSKVLSDALQRIAKQYTIIGPVVVNAACYGAPTNRRRIVVLGFDPSDVDPLTSDMFELEPPARLVTVRDAIWDLPGPVPEDKTEVNFGWARYPSRVIDKLSPYAHMLRQPPPSELGWKDAIEQHRAGYVSGLVATRHSIGVARRYASIVGGKTDKVTKSFRLEWDGQSPTLRAGTGQDKGAFQAVRPIHPGKSRVITVREAARLQGFPDWFVFHPTKWHSFRMIGNSVSPIVSHGLFTKILPKMHTSLA